MPHYKDGVTEARVGDVARGHCYGTGRVTEGVVTSIIAGADNCDCYLAFPVVLRPMSEGGMPVVTLMTGLATLGQLEKVC